VRDLREISEEDLAEITKLKDDLEHAQKILSGEVQKSVHVHKVQFEK